MRIRFVKTCKNPDCGKQFVTGSRNQEYCSPKCRNEAKKQTNKECKARMREQKKLNAIHDKYNTIDKTSAKCRELGISYAEHQIQQTLAMIPKINLEI